MEADRAPCLRPRPAGYLRDRDAKHVHNPATVSALNTQAGHTGNFDPGAAASIQVANAPPPSTTATTPHAADFAARPSSSDTEAG